MSAGPADPTDAAARWDAVAARLAATVAHAPDDRLALSALVDALVDDLGYAYACAGCGADRVERPGPPAPDLAAATAGALAAPSPDGPAGEPVGAARTHELVRFAIAAPGDEVRVVVVRPRGDGAPDDRARLARLATLLTHALAAGHLRRERDARTPTGDPPRAEATRAEAVRTEFLANMSHELRTPLTAILGYAELLRDPQLDPATSRGHVDIIVRSGRQLLQLLDDLLALARIESGRDRSDPAVVDLPALLADVHAMFAARARAAGLALEVRFATAIPDRVVLDGPRLRQIAVNLVGNAIKFTARGAVTVMVAADETMLTLDVVDTGPGLAPGQLAAIFDAFEPGGRRASGSGLGLAISRRLARMSGGDLEVESAPGQGSTFSVRMPFTAVAEAMPVAAPRAPAVDATGEALALRGRILVVDDNPVNRAVLQTVLTRAGLTADVADDGATGIAAVRAAVADGTPYDLVFMDMQMPIVDGYAATATLRGELPGLPIIAITAHAMPDDRARCLAAGCTEYLAKPVPRRDLLALLARYLAAPPATVTSENVDDEVIRELLGDFLTDARAIATALDLADRARDRGRVRDLAHRLKGSSATFGFPGLSRLAARLEQLAGRDRADDLELGPALAAVIAEIARTR